MAVATYRGEKSVGEIANKIYARLTPKQREKAEAALLKANPQLRKIKSLPKGSILRVPDLPELRTKTVRTLENPDAQIAENVSDALNGFSKRIGAHFDSDNESTKTQITLLKSAKLKRALADDPALQALADAASKALDARAKSVGARQEGLNKAIEQAQADLKKRAR